MNTKNRHLGILSFIIGSSCAFASTITPENVYIRATLVIGGEVVCVKTDRLCDDTGSSICKIIVNTVVGMQDASTSGANTGFVTYKSGCIIPIKNNTDNLGQSFPPIRIYSMTTEEP